MRGESIKLLFAALLLPLPLVTVPASTQAQEDEERENVIRGGEANLIFCDWAFKGVGTGSSFWKQKECDHNILFLKGLCEASNNTGYPWCYSGDMERYLNDRGLVNAPRPPNIWCNIDIDGCIEMYKEFKAEVEAMGADNPDSEPHQNLVETFDNKIQQLEANMRHEKETIAWEYGRCVFYDKTPVQVCNSK